MRFRFKFSTRLQFNCPYIAYPTWIDLWTLLCGVVFYRRWKNNIHLSFESLSDLQIDEQHEIWFLALVLGYLSNYYYLIIIKVDDMELIIGLMFFLTWVFRMQYRAKIRKPCNRNMIFGSLLFTICKQTSQISVKISKKEGKLHIS